MARYLEALFFFEKAIELNPQFPEALNNKGSCLFLIGRQKEAIECFTKLFELNQNFFHSNNNNIY